MAITENAEGEVCDLISAVNYAIRRRHEWECIKKAEHAAMRASEDADERVFHLIGLAAQRIEAGTDGTAQPVQPEGREPDGEADAPKE